MVKIGFNKDMEKLLTALKGQKLISLEYGKDPIENQAYGNMRLHFDKVTLEINNEEQPFPFFDDMEDIACFSCRKVKNEIPFCPIASAQSSQVITINETVTGLSIIRDHVTVNQGEYEPEIDMALIIYTTGKPIMLAKGIWWSEVITIIRNDDFEKLVPQNDVIDEFSEEGTNTVTLIRSKVSL